MTYQYELRNRPAMYGTVPPGYTIVSDTRNERGYGIVSYERQLTPAEVYRYELRVLTAPELPLYPVGTLVKVFNTGKVYPLEVVNGEYWVGDNPLRAIDDWYAFAPAAASATTGDRDDERAKGSER